MPAALRFSTTATVRLSAARWLLFGLHLLRLLRVFLLQLLRLLLVLLLRLLVSRLTGILFSEVLMFILLLLLQLLAILCLLCYQLILLFLVILVLFRIACVGSSGALDRRQFLGMDCGVDVTRGRGVLDRTPFG